MLAAGAEPELHAKTKMEIFVASCPPESLVALGMHGMVEDDNESVEFLNTPEPSDVFCPLGRFIT